MKTILFPIFFISTLVLFWSTERAVNDLKAVCGAFGNLEQSTASQVLNALGAEIKSSDLEKIKQRCAKSQFQPTQFITDN